MIKIGILGGENKTAGGILRLLVHHPEVEIIAVESHELAGKKIAYYHQGLIGDTELQFSDNLDFSELELVFVTTPLSSDEYKRIPESVKKIIVPDKSFKEWEKENPGAVVVPGLSEMFRKPLVREAKTAVLLSPALALSLIPLYPLALHLLLNDTISVRISSPKYTRVLGEKKDILADLNYFLRQIQFSFTKIKDLEIVPSDLLRTMYVEIEMDCTLSEEELERVYDSVYDDHNFSYIINSVPSSTEVAGTQKCIIGLQKLNEDRMKITAVGDGLMRGGAGDAIHVMNLLFGLYERIGLSFPASMAFISKEDSFSST